MQKVLILRGAPASGKSTIAKHLRDFEEKIVWLKVDNFKPFFADDASPALEYVNGSALAVLEYLLSEGFSVVMEGIFQDTKPLKKAQKIVGRYNVPCSMFQLRVDVETLILRDKTREGVKEGHRRPLPEKVIRKIYNVLEASIIPGTTMLDTSEKSIDECVQYLESLL